MPRGFKDEDDTVSFADVYVKHATEKALLCVIDGNDHWIPRSQIHDDSEVFDDLNNDQGKLVITRWLAEQKGLAEPDYGASDFDRY